MQLFEFLYNVCFEKIGQINQLSNVYSCVTLLVTDKGVCMVHGALIMMLENYIIYLMYYI